MQVTKKATVKIVRTNTVCPEIVSEIFSLNLILLDHFLFPTQERFNHSRNLSRNFSSNRIVSNFIVRDLQYQKESELDANSAPVASVVANAYSLIYDIDVHFPYNNEIVHGTCQTVKNPKLNRIPNCNPVKVKYVNCWQNVSSSL